MRYSRWAVILAMACFLGVGTALPGNAATHDATRTVSPGHHRGNPLSPGELYACARYLGIHSEAVNEIIRAGLTHWSLERLGEGVANNYILSAEVAYPVYDFWFNCVAPYIYTPGEVPPLTTRPTGPVSGHPLPGNLPPGTPVSPGQVPFYILGGGR